MLNVDLRPLGAGELLDRAVTLFVRHFAAITAVVAVAYVPYLVLYLVLGWASQTNEFVQSTWVTAFGNGVGAIIWALTRTALARTIGTVSSGSQPALGDAYRRAWRRLVPQLLTMVMAAAALLAIVVAAVVSTIVLMKVGSAFEPFLPGHPNTSPAIAVGVGILALPFLIWLWLAYQIAAVRVAETAVNPGLAFLGALGSTLAGSLRWRALIVGFVILVAPLAIGYGGVALGRIIPDPEVAFAVEKTLRILVSSLSEAFAIACVIVYDIDARVRSEGLDLVRQVDAET